MINKLILIGNVGKEPEIKQFDGGKVARFSLATSEKFKDRQGQQQEKTQWHNCVIWGKLADVCESYVHKGSKLYIEGKVEYRKYTAQDGADKYVTEVIVRNFQMLDSKQKESAPDVGNYEKVQDGFDEIPF